MDLTIILWISHLRMTILILQDRITVSSESPCYIHEELLLLLEVWQLQGCLGQLLGITNIPEIVCHSLFPSNYNLLGLLLLLLHRKDGQVLL